MADQYPNADLDGDLVKKNFTHVRVLHNFRGSNNDELCMKRDEVITLTQTPSGGWWEGTLDGLTGWFPANYVTPILRNDPLYQQLTQQNLDNGMSYSGYGQFGQDCLDGLSSENLAEYRAIVIKDIEDSESDFIQSLQDAINQYLKPLYQYKIFPSDTEINAVLRSITEICSVHRRFLTSLDKLKDAAPKENRIGGLFMQFAPQFKHAHFEYCANHAKFVHLVEKFKKEICNFFVSHPNATPSQVPSNASSMPNVIITSSLSVSFRRLDKYPALLQELQRYTEENHVDRGDTQRAGYLFRDIAMSCLELRRRKEMELEVMLGNIKHFDQMKIETFGSILKMEPVSLIILPLWAEPKKDCYLVLFPKVLMVLSVGNEMTSFTFESMMQMENSRMQVMQTSVPEKGTYQLEIKGYSAHPQVSDTLLTYVVQMASEDICKEWYQHMQKQIRHLSANSDVVNSSSGAISLSHSSSNVTSPQSGSSSSPFSPQTPSSSDPPLPPIGKPPISYRNATSVNPPTRVPPPPPRHRTKEKSSLATVINTLPKRTSFWAEQLMTSHPPYRPHTEHLSKSDDCFEQNEDIQLLNVIDSYYRKLPGNTRDKNSKSRKLSNPTIEFDCNEPQPYQLVEIMDNTRKLTNKTSKTAAHNRQANNKRSLNALVNKISKLSMSSVDRDILFEIYDQLKLLNNDVTDLRSRMNEERRQRKRMQQLIVAYLEKPNRPTQ